MNEPLQRRAFSQRAQRSPAHADDADPLAELARIVGADDPFHDIFGEAQRAGSKRAAASARPAAVTAVPAMRAGEFDDLPLGEAFAAQHGAAARQDYEAAYYDNLGGEPGYEQLPDEAEYYDDETELGPDISLKKRRGGLILAGAITLAVIGGAGYAMVRGQGGETVSGTPPVIHASTVPTKTIPERTADAPQHSKLIYDRVGANDKPGDEKVVSRTEEPVDLPEAPADAQPAPEPSAAGGAPAAASGGAPDAFPAQREPRKVRTVLIRPDGSAGGDPDVGLPAMGAPQASAAPAPAQPAGYPFSIIENDPLTRPDGAGGPSQAASAPPTLVMPPPAVAAPRPAAPKPATTAAAAPKPPAVVKPPVAPVASGPQRVASLPNPAGSPVSGPKVPAGGASVQLTSQRSEQDARAAFAALQKRFPGVLGSTQPSIQKADLGARGIYYRVKVVSGTRDAAVQLCSSLKSQGGDCVVGN